MDRPKKIILLGATGSIGTSTLRILRAHPDRLQLVGVAAHSKAEELAAIVREFRVPHAALTNADAADDAVRNGVFPSDCTLHSGKAGLTAIASEPEADMVLVAVVGTAALRPTLAAIEAGRDIALASKEILVLGGSFVMEAARKAGVRLLPTDSEHNAIFQCLEGHPNQFLDGIILTASGGRFRDRDPKTLDNVTPEEATDHPNWSMGPKITVDSATMANKGLELMEARWLFNLPPEKLEVVLHRQSIVHSFVRFVDGSILGQLSPPSMTFAIQHCLLHPERAEGVEPTLDFQETFTLDFAPPPEGRFPCLNLAFEALRSGPTAMAVFNAANELAVADFLARKIKFPAIPQRIAEALEQFGEQKVRSLEDLLALDAEVREAR
ncbi:MAG: 1-deoxy-D-xylulose-5-phosphate reductoisomerase [Verrucomicrobiota bacterium]